MSHSRNNNIIESDDSDLDPTGYQLEKVVAPAAEPIKVPKITKSVGFNTLTLTLNQNEPVRLLGQDNSRLRALLNVGANQNVLIGDASTVANLKGFNLTVHSSGGAIEITTQNEVWVVNTGASGVIVYVWVERSVTE